MSGRQVGVTKATVMARVRRFAALRAAQRALAPVVPSNDVFPPVEPLRDARSKLKEIVARIQAGRTQELANVSLDSIDAVFDGYARGLRQVADDIPLPQYRATLTESAREQREELVALLDLVLEDGPGVPKRLNLIDFLITLLAIGKEGASWSTIIDPPNVSERTRALSLNAPTCDPQLLTQILSRFQKASEALNAGGDFESIRTEIGAFKNKILDYLFVPEVMRCVVSYNLAVRMWHERRISDSQQGNDPGDSVSVLPPVAPDPRPLPPQAESPSPSLEPPTLSELEAAVAARVANTAAPPSSSARMIAASIDLGALGQNYARLFREPNPGATEMLRRQIIATGLVFQSLPGIEPTLGQCGLTPESVEEEWLRETSEGVRTRTNELIASNEYGEARELSDLQSRFLFAATVDARRKRGLETDVEKAVATRTTPTDRAPMHDLKEALAKAREGGDLSAPPPRVAAQTDRDAEPSSSRRALTMTVILALLVAASIFNLISANTVQGLYSANDLYALSPMLKSGYRTEDGKGPLFMGTMGPAWDDLEQPQRKELASNLRDRLAPAGIDEVMLYDQRRTLQVHYVGKRNEYPGWDDSPAAGKGS